MGWRFLRFTNFLVFILLTTCALVELPSFCETAPGSGDTWSDSSWPFENNLLKSNWDNNGGLFNRDRDNIRISTPEEDEPRDLTEMATKTIVAVVIFLVLASFIAFLICLCCPICILAKMRQRRRGFVYQTAATNGASTTVQANGTTVTVVNTVASRNANSSAAQPSGNANNTPYPVQPSMTVGQPHPPYPGPYTGQAAPYPTGPTGMPMPMAGPHVPPPTDLPPPYPGLPREMDNLNQQPAFNPYFSENQEVPNPYMSTTAPYPTK